MNKLNKSQLRSARTKILHQISVLDTQRCDYCIPDDESTWRQPVAHCNCDAAIQVRELGDVLMKLVSERVNSEDIDKEIPVFDFTGITLKTMTADKYHEIKDAGVTDSELSKNLSTGIWNINQWKRRNGITKRRKADVR